MFGIVHTPGKQCAGNSCATASGAYSGVYNSHASPSQGMGLVSQGNMATGVFTSSGHEGVSHASYGQGMGLVSQGNMPTGVITAPGYGGKTANGNYLITQSVASSATQYAPIATTPAPHQKVVVPSLIERGRPQIGGHESITDIGVAWQVCQNINMGLFNQQQCRQYPKFM
jgi:hypothetical protein